MMFLSRSKVGFFLEEEREKWGLESAVQRGDREREGRDWEGK